MANLSYKQQLLHPEWQKKRLRMLEAHGWACQTCGDKESTLHVHHKLYRKGAMVWEYEDDDLAVLCEYHHKLEHMAMDWLTQVIEVSVLTNAFIADEGLGPANVGPHGGIASMLTGFFAGHGGLGSFTGYPKAPAKDGSTDSEETPHDPELAVAGFVAGRLYRQNPNAMHRLFEQLLQEEDQDSAVIQPMIKDTK